VNGDDGERPGWARWVTLGALAVALVALAWTIYSVGFFAIVERLVRIGPWFAVVIGLEVLTTLFDAGAIYHFLRPEQKKVGYRRVVLAQLSGRAVNTVTPLGSLGEVVKTTMLMERVGKTRAFAAVLLYNISTGELSYVLIAVGATLCGILLDLPDLMRAVLIGSGAVTGMLAIALPVLVYRGVLSSVAGLGRTLRVISRKQAARWKKQLDDVDDKLRGTRDARGADRLYGLVCVVLSRFCAWSSTGVLIYASGGPMSPGFLAAVLTAGQVLSWVSAVVPLGLGITETGNYALFRALGVDPAIGVTVAVGRRVTQIIYAGIGLVLAAVNQTVKEAKAAQHRKVVKPASQPPIEPAVSGEPQRR
jgi:uncharacterized protein (TIRG00374 family)